MHNWNLFEKRPTSSDLDTLEFSDLSALNSLLDSCSNLLNWCKPVGENHIIYVH